MPDTLSPDRPLGKTGVTVPLVGYGTAPLGRQGVTREHAARCLNHAIDLGVTYLDTSPDYGSEPHVGEVMRTRRDEVFLATKVNCRSGEGALNELNDSLRRLQTDHVDLIQVHAVNTYADLEQALAPDGACAGLEEARRQGLARFIGITGHSHPSILALALEQYPFDTVLAALSIGDHLVTAPDVVLLPKAAARSVGVIAMKVLAYGRYPSRGLALRYTLGLPGVSLAILGLETPEQIDEAVRTAASFRPLDEAEEDRLIAEVRPLVEKDAGACGLEELTLGWLHDTTVMGWRENDEPAGVRY